MKPMFVERIENSDGNVMKTYAPEVYNRLVDENSASVVAEYMRAVVTSGTGTVLKSAKYTSAGKTGSAEADSSGTSHAWFTGFAPYEDPEIAVTIIIEGAGTGGSYAVPMAKRIFDCYFDEKAQE